MATSTPRLLLGVTILLGLLAIAANARPLRCKTLIVFSTTTTTTSSSSYSYPHVQYPNLPRPRRSVTYFFTEVTPLDPTIFAADEEENRPQRFGFYSSMGASTKDILTVVGSLLFGVGCGALTAATLFLVWSLFDPSRFDLRDSDDEFDDYEDEDDVSPKKMGYVAIPAVDSAPAAAKEVV